MTHWNKLIGKPSPGKSIKVRGMSSEGDASVDEGYIFLSPEEKNIINNLWVHLPKLRDHEDGENLHWWGSLDELLKNNYVLEVIVEDAAPIEPTNPEDRNWYDTGLQHGFVNALQAIEEMTSIDYSKQLEHFKPYVDGKD